MQPEKLCQRFEHMEDAVAKLARTCALHKDVPDTLKQSIQQLDDQARQCHSRLEGAEDPQTFAEAIGKLEVYPDHAKTTYQNAGGRVDHSVESAVIHTHGGLSQFRHKLH